MADIFISYSQADRDWVEKLARLIEKEGFSVWWDIKVLPGDEFGDLVVKEIATSKCVVVVWSKHSVQSDWVYGEADEARKTKKLVPVIKDEVHLPTAFRKIHTADLSQWDHQPDSQEFAVLLDAVRARVRALGPSDPVGAQMPAGTAPPSAPPGPQYWQAPAPTSPPPGTLRAGLYDAITRVGQLDKVTLRIIAVATIVVDLIKYGSYFSNPAIDFWNLFWLLSEWADTAIFAVFAFSKKTVLPWVVRAFLGVSAALSAEQIGKIFIPEGPPPSGALLYLIAYAANFITLGLIATVPSSKIAERMRPYALATIAYYLLLDASNSTVTHGSDGIVWFLAAALRHALEAIMVCAAPFQYQRGPSLQRLAPYLVGLTILALLTISLFSNS
jgi:hypothetical protein